MLSQKLQNAINEQINAELWSAYLYLSMGMNFEVKGLSGIANWFKIQFKEEQDHAFILMNFMHSRDAKVELKPIKEVPTEWETPLAAFEKTLEHEKVVTKLINDLYFLAEDERDIATRTMLNWFVNEQVEEEENARELIDRLRMIGDNGYGLYELNRELGNRAYTTPAPLASKE